MTNPEKTRIRKSMEETETAHIYGRLFGDYSDTQFEDSIRLFFDRFEKWRLFPMSWLKGKACLDAGCGQGRYVVALGRAGAAKAVGIDINDYVLDAARQRRQFAALDNVELRHGSVLNIPFDDRTFDFVICSGVAHHTPTPRKVFEECTRVLKPGGYIYFAVYGRSLYWRVNGLFRGLARFISFDKMDALWRWFRVPANKRYNYLDNLYVPYCFNFTQKEVMSWFAEDYASVQRLEPQEKHFMRFFGMKKGGETE